MEYEDTQRMVERSSWFQEIIGRPGEAARLIGLSREGFEKELRAVMARHAQVKPYIDEIKRLCRVTA
jgi:predicted HTH domain antitoxin